MYVGLNDTANPPDQVCTLEEVCGFGGFHGHDPNQWFRCVFDILHPVIVRDNWYVFRFITPIFLHAGIIHIMLNMIAQMTLSAHIEREMGSTGFLITYLAAGIFGYVHLASYAIFETLTLSVEMFLVETSHWSAFRLWVPVEPSSALLRYDLYLYW